MDGIRSRWGVRSTRCGGKVLLMRKGLEARSAYDLNTQQYIFIRITFPRCYSAFTRNCIQSKGRALREDMDWTTNTILVKKLYCNVFVLQTSQG